LRQTPRTKRCVLILRCIPRSDGVKHAAAMLVWARFLAAAAAAAAAQHDNRLLPPTLLPQVADKFYVTKRGGGKVTAQDELTNIKRVLEVLLRGRAGPATPRPKFTTVSIQADENKRELLYTLMGARMLAAALCCP
jgi:hypothetical protein